MLEVFLLVFLVTFSLLFSLSLSLLPLRSFTYMYNCFPCLLFQMETFVNLCFSHFYFHVLR